MKNHPFKPLISNGTRKLLIGTLPPEEVKFYFSNSSNTRLWDILTAISEGSDVVAKGGNIMSDQEKINILKKLGLGITDIIYTYERDDYYSTRDADINPKTYLDLLGLASKKEISDLLFVYQSAYKWFLHSLQKAEPVRLKRLKGKYGTGWQNRIEYKGAFINCTLLPSPLNRGRKGETLLYKLAFYRSHILGPHDR